MGTFYADVVAKDARFASSVSIGDPVLLEPMTRQLVERLVSAARQMGIEVMIYETYRSQDRQQELFNSGASKLRTVGVHHYGLACDIVRSVGGEPAGKATSPFWVSSRRAAD
jgi:LAS superfamily LD-carboxypeptidase LdcB